VKIGVLAAQGAFAEHLSVLGRLDVEAIPVRVPDQLSGLSGLIIPGGESTTISKLMVAYGLLGSVKEMVVGGMPVFGTCAGMIMLAKNVVDGNTGEGAW
jgi:5'-phosphate synthase pdxT subunit